MVFSALMASGAMQYARASAPVIGMASAQSGATLDDAKVSGTATIFDGSKIRADGYSRLHLNNGARLDLAAGSQAQIFGSHAALETGSGEVEAVSGYEIDARTLKIRLAEKNSIARVRIGDSDKRVYVTALNAPVSVLNNMGMLVAKVSPGSPMSFEPQGAAPTFEQTWCVVQKNGAAITADDNGGNVTELRGVDLRKAIGRRTHIVGTVDPTATPAGGAGQVVNVKTANYQAKGASCSGLASKLGASTAAAGLAAAAGAGAAGGAAAAGAAGAAAGAAAGVAVGTTAAVVGGVAAAAAATVGGLSAAGTFSTPSP